MALQGVIPRAAKIGRRWTFDVAALRGWIREREIASCPSAEVRPVPSRRGDVLWGRIQVKGQDVRWSLRTSDPKLARERLKADRERLIAQAHYGATTRRLFDEVLAEWARHIPDQVGARTARRYACSLHAPPLARRAHHGAPVGAYGCGYGCE